LAVAALCEFNLIDLLGGTDRKVLAPQAQKTTTAGSKVIAPHYIGFKQPFSHYISGAVAMDD